MKKLIFFLATIFTSFSLSASHFAGAEIGYEYLSTNTNGSHDYKVRLQIYRDISGIPLDLNQSLCISSSCFGQQTVALTFLPVLPQNGGNARQALPVPGLSDCVDANDPDLVTIEIYYFEATVTLQGNCPNWKFSWHGNARNVNNIDNLTFIGNSDLYVETLLNNTIGQNTSPTFVNPAAKSFCVGSPFTWSQAATEPDGDSLRYSFGHPLNAPFGAVCTTPTLATFAAGYSVLQPMTTVSGINIDEKVGTFSFTPSQIETDVVNVIVEEYRLDPVTTLWLKVGTTVRDLQIPIVGACLQATAAGPKINTSASGFSNEAIEADTMRAFLYGLGLTKAVFDSTLSPRTDSIGVVEYNCGDSIINLSFSSDVLCSTVSPDGTDFRLVGPDSAATAIPAVSFACQTDLTTNNIALLLHQPLDQNGDYYLQIKNGNDGNTLQNECGFSLTPFYTLKVMVQGCTQPIYNLENVTVVADSTIKIEWTKIDSTVSKKLFTSWNILRSNNNQFYPIDNVTDYNATSYVDNSADANAVDNIQFQYAIQLVQNFNAKSPSNTINNILLKESTNDQMTTFDWSDYLGWTNAEYHFEHRNISTSEPWQSLAGPTASILSYDYDHPEITEANEGIYVYRVIATNPAAPAAYIAESNWLYLEFKNEPVIDDEPYIANIPNVITPNGDSQNDFFYINDNTYSNISVSIFNRWGKLVYQDLNASSQDYTQGKGWDGTDINTGQPASDGVYFYLVEASDFVSGKSEELKGPLTIIRGTH
ncbi:gliding motility-associated C-terminal domain-containing protein [Owenweeksia hongkongensis]|uniref:gliding motility-associated C-terminal domain-containing protein n=1 Tax=Owenweeksia hongkongensis TaxID=253245 RepID=UPI003A8C9E77